MATLPYVTSPGNIDRALTGMKTAAVPPKVSQDFVKTILKIPGGSGDQMTSFLKKIGFSNADGSPSELYKSFRNPASSGRAMAQAIRFAYAPLFTRNEFAYELSDAGLIGLIVEETGLAVDANPVKLIASSIKHLKKHASFDENDVEPPRMPVVQEEISATSEPPRSPSYTTAKLGLSLGYTINLNLPATSDPAVFDAIFKSLKENLLREDDA